MGVTTTETNQNEQHTRLFLSIVLKITFGLLLLFSLLLLCVVQKVDVRFIMSATLTIAVGISHILLKKKRTKAASYLFLFSFWMVVSVTLFWRAGSIRGPVMACSIVVTLLAGLLLGTRGGALFACLHLLTGGLLVYGEITGQITYTPATFPLMVLFLYTVLFGITLAFLYAYKTQLQTALQHALDSEQQLIKNNLTLMYEVEKRKQIEQQLSRYMTQLEAKNSELQQFSYLTSHDLQEPLRTLINFSSILQEEYQDKLDEDGQLYLSFIHDASQQMRQLVHGLLRYSQVGKNQTPQSVDCHQIADSIMEDLGLIIAETNATISYDNLPTIEAYPVELRQLLQNLLENAIKFRHPNTPPHIEIKAEDTPEHWHFSIHDNGIGIAPKHQDRIFTIFQRLHTAKEYPGTGIGLAKCKKIVDLHNGRIWVDSMQGEGSTFFFTISKQQATPALTDTQS